MNIEGDKERTPFVYQSLNDEALERLAQDIVAGRIFGSWEGEDAFDSFIPFLLLSPQEADDLKRADIVAVYEYMDAAGPLSVNGAPSFMSMKMLDRADYEKLRPRVEALLKILKDREHEAANG